MEFIAEHGALRVAPLDAIAKWLKEILDWQMELVAAV
jgi:hypothetical protein